MARSMESLTTIAMQQQQQQQHGIDVDGPTLDRLASFAAISDTSVASRTRLRQKRRLASGRKLSLPGTAKDIYKADA